MPNQDWTNLGEEVKRVVQSAIDSQDFKQLNSAIKNTVNSAMDNVSQLKGDVDWNRPQRHAQEQNPWNHKRERSRNTRIKVPYNELYGSTGKVAGPGYALAIIGGIFGGAFGITLLVFALVGTFIGGGISSGISIATAIILPLFLASLLMFWKGSKLLKLKRRFQSYVMQIGERSYCSIEELSQSVGKSKGFVLKDLKNMFQRKMFTQGHLDRQGTCLMVTDEAYQQYLDSVTQLETRQKQEIEGRSAISNTADGEAGILPEEVKKVIAEGMTYLDQIKRCNDEIKGEEISQKISRLELVTSKIFKRLEKDPKLVQELRKFMEYYLPTTIKLLNAYEELDEQPVQGQNILSSKKEIENTLDTINQAFESLLDSFFEDTAWDISSDISVLQTMFQQEGLTGHTFSQQDKQK